MTTSPPTPGGRRRSAATRRIGVLGVLAVVVPLLAVAAAFGLQQPEVGHGAAEPVSAPLTRADRGCPSAPDGRGQVLVASAHETASGEVELRDLDEEDAEPEALAVPPGAVAASDAGGSTLVTGRAELAPGLLAVRVDDTESAAVTCPAPTPEAWFTGLGARAQHGSVVELQNPDVGAAVVDVSFFTRQGPAEVPELLGVRVPGRSTYRVDLASSVPRRGDVTIRLVVTRGRLSTTVSDRFAPIGSDIDTSDWLAPQPEPATSTLLLGLPAGRGTRGLTLTNPGTAQARVTLKLVTPESTFTPSDLKEVQVRPGSLVNVPLKRILGREVREGAVGVLVEATQPVTSSLTSVIGGDRSVSPDPPDFTGSAVAVLPAGRRTLVIAGATTTGLATVAFRDAEGFALAEKQVELTPGRAFEVTVPDRAAVAVLTLARTTACAVVLVEDDGAVVLPFTVPDEAGLVPAVRPADR